MKIVEFTPILARQTPGMVSPGPKLFDFLFFVQLLQLRCDHKC